jgi:hypothetical protein
LNEIRSKAEELNKDSEALAEEFLKSLSRLDAEYPKLIQGALRRTLVEEIQDVEKEVASKTKMLLCFEGEELWVSSDVERISVTKFRRTYARDLARRMEVNLKIRMVPLYEFRERMRWLKSFISEGRLDEALRMRKGEAIYETMGYGGKLWPKIEKIMAEKGIMKMVKGIPVNETASEGFGAS